MALSQGETPSVLFAGRHADHSPILDSSRACTPCTLDSTHPCPANPCPNRAAAPRRLRPTLTAAARDSSSTMASRTWPRPSIVAQTSHPHTAPPQRWRVVTAGGLTAARRDTWAARVAVPPQAPTPAANSASAAPSRLCAGREGRRQAGAPRLQERRGHRRQRG